MAGYIVSYDLNKQGKNYDCIIEKIESYPLHWHMQKSVWIVILDDDATAIYKDLQPCLDGDDKLFVAKLTKDTAWSSSYGDKVASWLRANL